jgi:ABC-type lipoprotein export system ATPase subunit
MIKTEKLQKIFQTEEVKTWALNSIDLDIHTGEFVAIAYENYSFYIVDYLRK